MKKKWKNFSRIVNMLVAAGLLLIVTGCNSSDSDDDKEPAAEAKKKNIILMIADGSQLEHEKAYSRFVNGDDMALTSADFPYQGWNTSWDVTTYDMWAWNAARQGIDIDNENYNNEQWIMDPGSPTKDTYTQPAPKFTETSMNPVFGYNSSVGGVKPFPVDETSDMASERYLAMPPKDIYNGSENAKIERAKGRDYGKSFDEGSSLYPATDSASSATAMATGRKTDAGNISWLPSDPENGQIKTIAELAREQKGAAIGIVSSVEFSHATPACFASHNVNRSNYSAIATEILTSVKPDVVIGSGHPDCGTTKYTGSQEIYDSMKNGTNPDYVFAEHANGVDGNDSILAAASTVVANIEAGSGKTKLFGLYGAKTTQKTAYKNGYGEPAGTEYDDVHFHPPQPKTDGSGEFERIETKNPTLAAATEAALKVLSKDKDGFFLMVEGGDIDWANHANDYEWMLGAWYNFDMACKKAVEFIDQPDDDITWENTMVIIATDHGNNYMRLKKYYGKGQIPPGEERQLCQSAKPETVGIKFSSNDHTNELVTLYAKGGNTDLLKKYEGSWHEGTRILDNTHIFFAMAEWLGVEPGYSPMTPVSK